MTWFAEYLSMAQECLARRARLDHDEVVFCNMVKHSFETGLQATVTPKHLEMLDQIWEKATR